jgi:hypothetical protein
MSRQKLALLSQVSVRTQSATSAITLWLFRFSLIDVLSVSVSAAVEQ